MVIFWCSALNLQPWKRNFVIFHRSTCCDDLTDWCIRKPKMVSWPHASCWHSVLYLTLQLLYKRSAWNTTFRLPATRMCRRCCRVRTAIEIKLEKRKLFCFGIMLIELWLSIPWSSSHSDSCCVGTLHCSRVVIN